MYMWENTLMHTSNSHPQETEATKEQIWDKLWLHNEAFSQNEAKTKIHPSKPKRLASQLIFYLQTDRHTLISCSCDGFALALSLSVYFTRPNTCKSIEFLLQFGNATSAKTFHVEGSVPDYGTISKWWSLQKVKPTWEELGKWEWAFEENSVTLFSCSCSFLLLLLSCCYMRQASCAMMSTTWSKLLKLWTKMNISHSIFSKRASLYSALSVSTVFLLGSEFWDSMCVEPCLALYFLLKVSSSRYFLTVRKN